MPSEGDNAVNSATADMKITEEGGSTAYHTYLLLALEDAVRQFARDNKKLEGSPPLSEENATPELTNLHYLWEQRRAVVIVLAATCVEALANLFLGHKCTPEQFAVLKRAKPIEKWDALPALFYRDYKIPKGGLLWQDLNRLFKQRNRIVHLEEEITRGGSVMHKGKLPLSAGDEAPFVNRCAELPLKLAEHLGKFDAEVAGSLGGTVGFARVWPDLREWASSWAKHVVGKRQLSAQDYCGLPKLPGAHYELVEGELTPIVIETNRRNVLAERLLFSLNKFVAEHKPAVVVSLAAFELLGNTVRVPDIALMANGRSPAPPGPFKGAPDLVVHIASPEQTAYEHHRRLSDYFAAGCKRVWLVYPEDREVYIHGLAGVARRRGDETLEDPELLPGFAVKVSSIFEP